MIERIQREEMRTRALGREQRRGITVIIRFADGLFAGCEMLFRHAAQSRKTKGPPGQAALLLSPENAPMPDAARQPCRTAWGPTPSCWCAKTDLRCARLWLFRPQANPDRRCRCSGPSAGSA